MPRALIAPRWGLDRHRWRLVAALAVPSLVDWPILPSRFRVLSGLFCRLCCWFSFFLGAVLVWEADCHCRRTTPRRTRNPKTIMSRSLWIRSEDLHNPLSITQFLSCQNPSSSAATSRPGTSQTFGTRIREPENRSGENPEIIALHEMLAQPEDSFT